jgi:hypothetical membrane protein
MEIYIPSLLVLTLALFFIVILSQINPFVLFIIASITLVLVGIQHANLFTYEYTMSTWQNIVKDSSATLAIFLVVIMSLGFIFNLINRGVSTSGVAAKAPQSLSYFGKTSTPPAYGTNTLRSLVRDPFRTR